MPHRGRPGESVGAAESEVSSRTFDDPVAKLCGPPVRPWFQSRLSLGGRSVRLSLAGLPVTGLAQPVRVTTSIQAP